MEKLLYAIEYIVIYTILLACPTMWLWDWLMPTLFSLPTITFWQACGLNLLCNILFNKTRK